MEVLVLLFLVIILVVIFNLKNSLSERLASLEKEIIRLQDMLSKASLKTGAPEEPPLSKPIVVPPKETTKRPEERYWETSFKVAEEQDDTRLQEQLKSWKPAENTKVPDRAHVVEKAAATISAAPPPVPSFQPAKPTFFERNPDLEKFIGENLVSKIGIGILVLAIGYFVKFAIDNNWIGEIGRVGIGLLCGGILVGLAHKMRNSYKAFSSVLTGGGLAVFYFTIALAYHQFHLFSQSTAFIIMLVITAFAVMLSLIYDRQEVAIIALVGGFASPFMVSDGSGNYKTLFIYLIILNAGLLVLAYNKAWRLLNLLAFIFTVILFGGWLFSLPDNEAVATYSNAFIFLTIFYVLFFAINIAHNIKENKKFISSDFGILLANTSLYFAAGLYCLYNMQAEEYQGLFSAAMGLFNLSASYLLFRNRKVDTNILYLLIGITLTFISLTAPLQLEGNFITLFWASECVLLYWLFQQSKIPIIEISSVIVWICMLISLVMDWIIIYKEPITALNIILNKGFTTSLYSAVASYALFLLRQKDYKTAANNHGFLIPSRLILRSVAIVLLFVGGMLEVNHQFRFYYPGTDLNQLYIQLYVFVFVLLLLLISQTKPSLKLPFNLQVSLLSLCILIYMLLINENFELQVNVLTGHKHQLLFTVGHIAMAVLAGGIVYRLVYLIRNDKTTSESLLNAKAWIICIVVIIFITVEMNLLVRALFYSQNNPVAELQRIFVKTVLPILWGLCSFAFMWLGMKYKFRPLRIISLSLFSLTLIKLFVFDIRNIPVAGKIAAFFCLGVLLLVVSFMYQRLKKIIIEDEQKTSV